MAGAMSAGTMHYECGYQLVIDNLLDLTHETYVHANSIGSRAILEHPVQTTRDDETVTVTRWMNDHEPAPFWATAVGQSSNVDRWQIVEFSLPSIVRLDVGVALAGTGAPAGNRSQGASAWNLHAITPETESSCWDFWSFTRNFRLDEPGLTEELNVANGAVIAEDKRVLDAQQRSLDSMPSDFELIDLNVDAGGLQARRVIETALQRENGR